MKHVCRHSVTYLLRTVRLSKFRLRLIGLEEIKRWRDKINEIHDNDNNTYSISSREITVYTIHFKIQNTEL